MNPASSLDHGRSVTTSSESVTTGWPGICLCISSDRHFLSALGGSRTPNLLIRSQMLYPLSYERSFGTESRQGRLRRPVPTHPRHRSGGAVLNRNRSVPATIDGSHTTP